MPCGADCSIDVPVSKQAGAENRVRLRIRKIAQTRMRYGYCKIRVLLNREGWKVG